MGTPTEHDEEDEAEDEDEEDTEETETATEGAATPAEASGTVWEDDFEAGSLDRYTSVEIVGDDDTAGYEIVDEPSQGDYAVKHRTESRVLMPAEPVSFEPPATATFDVYIDGWSGVDLILQWNREAALSYNVSVRNNASGGFIRIAKKRDEDSSDTETLLSDIQGKNSASVIEAGRWEPIEVEWTEEAVEVTATSSDSTVRIEDSDEELRGNSFGFLGYHYHGFAALDNVVVEGSGGSILG